MRGYFARSRADFPDQRNENSVLRTVADGVVVEFDLLGTHAALGTTFRSRMIALFLFEDGGDGIVCERAYFDTGVDPPAAPGGIGRSCMSARRLG